MAKAEEVNRSYSGSDADMVQASRVMHGLFTEDKSAFTNFDLAFSDPFGENWLQKIEAANAVVRDTLPLGELTEFTKRLQIRWKNVKNFSKRLNILLRRRFRKKRKSGLNLLSVISIQPKDPKQK